MKSFTDRMTRWPTRALQVHAFLLLLFGIVLLLCSLDYLKHPWGTPAWRIIPPLGGSVLAILVGAIIALLCAARLKKPFDGVFPTSVLKNFMTLFTAETIAVFGGGFIDAGGIMWRMMLGTLILNLILLVVFGGRCSSRA